MRDAPILLTGGAGFIGSALVRHLVLDLGPPVVNVDAITSHVTDRPGLDSRYAIDASETTASLGWAPTIDLVTGLRETVEWYAENDARSDQVLRDRCDGGRVGLGVAA